MTDSGRDSRRIPPISRWFIEPAATARIQPRFLNQPKYTGTVPNHPEQNPLNRPRATPFWVLTLLCGLAGVLPACTSFTASEPPQPRVIRRPDLTPLPPPRAKGEPDMRVRLAARQTAATVAGPREVRVSPAGDAAQLRVLATPVEFNLTVAAWNLRDARGQRTVIPRSGAKADDQLIVRPVAAAPLSLNGVTYAGEFRFMPRRFDESDSAALPTFDVIEFVPLEQYLPGVVSKELIPSWSLEAFKAQTVAARSYAIHERDRSIRDGATFDVEASEQDQAYAGATTNPTAIEAVKATRGQVLLFNGSVLRTYYSSCCGGRAGSARDTWPIQKGFEFNLAEPIQGRDRPVPCPCNFSQRYRWTCTRPLPELVQRIRAYGRAENLSVRDLGSLSRVVVTANNDAGRPAAYRLFDNAGRWYPLSAEQLRLACNTPAQGLPPIDAKTRVFSGDLAFTFTDSTVRIDGRGFGHGVGMCQFGAEGHSRKGVPFAQILQYYYPGATLGFAY